ncbi:MAG: DinB family protein [Acidobacteria bacterium]|nr:DinB family protein [Acidobacteriota bacterium]
MGPLQPDQGTFLLQLYLEMLKNEHPLTTNVIAAIPPGCEDYRPDSISRTALDLAWHIVSSEIRFLEAVASGEFNYSGSNRPASVESAEEVVGWYTASFSECFDRLAKLSKRAALSAIDFRGMFRLPAVVYLQFALNHTIHHRGQLSVYLRPMGAKVPSIYGESFDAGQARKAAPGPACTAQSSP